MLPPWLPAALLHVLLLGLYLDWGQVIGNPPVADTDFASHWAEAWSVGHFLDHGRLWGYDPHFMAGQPEGTLFDVDNKLVEVATWAIGQSGLPLPLAYNLVLATLILIAPLTIYPAARWLGLGRRDALLSQLAALGLWFLDPALRWAWQGGTFAFVVTVPLALLGLAAAARLVRPGPPPRPVVWLAWFGLGPLLFWLHALAFALLALPLAVLWLRAWPGLPWPRRLAGLLWPPLVLLASLPWLLTTLRFLGARTSAGQFLQGGLPALAADLLGIGAVDGASTVSLLGLRWLVLLLGGLGLAWLARRSAAGLAVAAAVWAGLLLAYGAVHLPGGGDLQPYRYLKQSMLWSTIGLGPGLRVLIALFAPGPHLLPRPPITNPPITTNLLTRTLFLAATLVALLWIGYGGWRFRPPPLGGPPYNQWQGPSAEAHALCDYLRTLPLQEGRVLLDDARVGALLPWCSGAQVIGGHFGQIWTRYGFSNATPWNFLDVLYRDYTVAAWQRAMTTYNVYWIVAHQAWNMPGWYTLAEWLADHPDQVVAGPAFGPYQFYQVARPTASPPFSVPAGVAGLHVTATPGAESFVLPYHWITTLRTVPATVQIQPQPTGRDPIPFIAVQPNGATDFLICHEPLCPKER